MAQANNKDEYIRAWNAHINEFTRVQLEFTRESDVKEVSDIMNRLRELVKKCAEGLEFNEE